MIQNVIYYNKFSLTQIQSETIENVPVADSKSYCRLEIPSNQSNINALFKKGYVFVERTLGVSINLSKDEIDYKQLIRFDIKKVQANNEDVLRIAIDSFPTDRRFHIRPEYDNSISEIIIRDWVSKLNEIYVCVYKDKIIGFIDLEPYNEKDCFIHLAAVQKEYRATGAAVALYAHAIIKAKEKGCNKICGRISSANVAVMNLYTRLGGTFSEPIDVYLRNEK